MKTRAKSTKENLIVEAKMRKPSEENKAGRKSIKKQQNQIRKNLLKALTLLESKLNLKKIDKKTLSTNNLSSTIYEIVKENIGQLQNHNESIRHPLKDCSLIEKNTDPNRIFQSSSSCLINPGLKRRSNSTLDQYFKDKFGSPPKDQESVQKKLRVLKALKKSQQIVSKNIGSISLNKQNSNGMINRNNCFQNSLIHSSYEINDKNIVIQKIKSKRAK